MISSSCTAGYADRNITPQTPLFLVGFANPPERKGKDIRTPLMAQAVCLQDEQGELALFFALDVLGFDRTWSKEVRSRLSENLGIPIDRIILNASHTHCGPQIRKDEKFAVFEPCDEGYRGWLAEQLIELGDECMKGRSSCRVSYAVGTNRQATCRRLWHDGQWLNAPNREGITERQLPLMECRWQDGRVLVIMIIAGHPTTAPDALYDAHYQGATRALMRRLYKSETIVFSGVGGDMKMTNIDPQTGGWANDAALDVLSIAEQVEMDRQNAGRSLVQMAPWNFRSASTTVELPLWNRVIPDLSPEEAREVRLNRPQFQGYSRRLESRSLEISVFAWNRNCRWIFLEGEVCGEYGSLLREIFDTGHTAVVAYCQSLLAYIPSAQIALEGGYEGNQSFAYVAENVDFPPYHPLLENEIIRGVKKLKEQLEGQY